MIINIIRAHANKIVLNKTRKCNDQNLLEQLELPSVIYSEIRLRLEVILC